MELPKAYNWKDYEDKMYKLWKESGYFQPGAGQPPADNPEYFAVMMPPPNVTGVLHLGHALENALMDIQIRYQRMQGKRALLLPGTDHAAVATQARVEDNLKKQGIDNPRKHYGREGLLEVIREFAEDSKATILNQIRKMGTSADWDRLAYTFDEERNTAVNTVFKKMYDDGLIYRGYRVVHWSVKGQSTCSDDELVHVERPTVLYTFKYAKDFPIPIASTRPETKLGDVAVAVHPDDERYLQYIGQQFTVDLGAAQPLTITVIADKNVDPTFGTGALGVTPAHSQIDFEMYEKNKSIGLIPVIGKDGLMTTTAGENYVGLSVEEARIKFVQWLKDADLLIAEEDTTQNVGTSDRFGDVVEALPMEQWFVAVNKVIPGRNKTLKQLMQTATQHDVHITPERFNDTYLHWIDNLRDWCISRQIWWGHRIPVWYRNEEVVVSAEQPAGEGWIQDEDTLDTWFSSALWTFSTLGWPDQKIWEQNRKFHPTAWIQMGHEILFFWMARMILMSTYVLDEVPFREVYIHGILRAKDGRKFSKSLGNGIDPLEMIEKYGTDALRLSLIKGVTPGNDARFYEEKVEDARNFVNKLWNVSRFVLMGASDVVTGLDLSLPDQWIKSRLANVVQTVTGQLDNNQFSAAAEQIYEFLWHEFADWYVEITKFQPNPKLTQEILETILKLLHPFTPFITEAMWQEIGKKDLLIIEQWPKANLEDINLKIEKEFVDLQDIITQVRDIRAKYNITYKTEINLYSTQVINDAERTIIEKICKIKIVNATTEGNAIDVMNHRYQFQIHGGDVVNIEQEKARLQKEIAKLEKQITPLAHRLKNKEYVAKAPAKIIQQDRDLLKEQEQLLRQLQESLQQL